MTDLRLNRTREYNFHYEMVLVWVLMVAALGNSFNLALSMLSIVKSLKIRGSVLKESKLCQANVYLDCLELILRPVHEN